MSSRRFASITTAIESNRGYGYFARVRDAEGQEFVEDAGGSPARNWAGCGAFVIDDIVPIEDCSGHVSTVSRSWGAIKQMYD